MTCVLLVEDSAAMRSHLRAALEAIPELGDSPEIVEAASGFEALRLLPKNRYDVVIADVNLPKFDGIEVIRFARQSAQSRDAGLIVMSNRISDRDRERAAAAGADDFLAKPITPEVLRETVVRILSAERRSRPSNPL